MMDSRVAPLDRFPFVDTTDPYVARKKQSKVWAKHWSRVSNRRRYRVVHNRADLGCSALNYLDMSVSITAEATESQGRYWLILPVDGHIEVAINGKKFGADAAHAVLQSPWEDYRFRTAAARAFFYEFDGATVDRLLPEGYRGHRGYLIAGPQRWALQRLLFALADSLDDWKVGNRKGEEPPTYIRHIETAITACVGDAVSEHLTSGPGAVFIGEKPFSAVRGYMSDHLAADISVTDIAAFAGVSVRKLQIAFADLYAVTPKQLLTMMRLDRARELLASPSGPASVALVCQAVGNRHPGRFSKEYAARFGESPSDTLRARRASESAGFPQG